MALDTLIVGVAPGQSALRAAAALSAVLEADDLEVIRNGPQWPTASQLARWALLHRPTQRHEKEALPLHPAITFAAILHKSGQQFPIYRYARQKAVQIGFIGLQQYRRDCFGLTADCLERGAVALTLLEAWPEPVEITQADIARDYLQSMPAFKNGRLYRALCKRHKPERMHGGGYCFQSKKARYLRIYAYPKTIKDRLAYHLIRLELSAGAGYWRRYGQIEPDRVLDFVTEKITSSAQKLGISLM